MEPLALDTAVRIRGGWATIGDLRVGDQVFDSAGEPTRVASVTETMIGKRCYRVAFDDGQSVVASAEHGWTVTACHRKGVGDPAIRDVTTVQMVDLLPGHSLSIPTVPVAGVEMDPRGSVLPRSVAR